MAEETTYPDTEWSRNLRNLVLPEILRDRYTERGLQWALEEAITESEREIIGLRIGRYGPVLSQEYIALGLGITLTSVRRLENAGKHKILEAVQKDPFSWV